MTKRIVVLMCVFCFWAQNIVAATVARCNWNIIPLPSEVNEIKSKGFTLKNGCTVRIAQAGDESENMQRNARMLIDGVAKAVNISLKESNKKHNGEVALAINSALGN